MIKLDKQLLALYILTLVAGLGIYVYCEFVNPITTAPLTGMDGFKDVKYVLEVFTDLLAIGFCYLSARLMTLRGVQRSIASNKARYGLWAYLRWGMLALVIFLGIGVHYLFLSASTIGCPIIGGLSLFFGWPTAGRRVREIEMAVSNQQPRSVNAAGM